MLLLSLFACLEPGTEIVRVDVDLKKDVVKVHWELQDVRSNEKCGEGDSDADCLKSLADDLKLYTDAFKDTTSHTQGYVVRDGRLDFVADYTAPTAFFTDSDSQVKQVHLLSAKEIASGAAGKVGIAMMFDNDPKERRSAVTATGSARLIRMPGKEGSSLDLWLVEKGAAHLDATIRYLDAGVEVTHDLLKARPALLDAMKAEKLL